MGGGGRHLSRGAGLVPGAGSEGAGLVPGAGSEAAGLVPGAGSEGAGLVPGKVSYILHGLVLLASEDDAQLKLF